MTTLSAWLDATQELSRTLYAEALPVAVANVTATIKTKSGKFTPTHQIRAEHIARGVATAAIYNLDSYNGVRSPYADDKVWGPNSDEKKQEASDNAGLEDLADWLAKQTWSEFAVSLASQYRNRGSLSPKQIASATSMRAKVEARNAERNAPAADGLDLSDLPEGYYGVPNGETRLKVRVKKPESGKWAGFTFVDDGAKYGEQTKYGMQRPDSTYRGKIEDQLRKIVADPKAAGEEYARLTGRCYACNLKLEDELSVSLGIGPVCRNK